LLENKFVMHSSLGGSHFSHLPFLLKSVLHGRVRVGNADEHEMGNKLGEMK
jgi:hypothetical protein